MFSDPLYTPLRHFSWLFKTILKKQHETFGRLWFSLFGPFVSNVLYSSIFCEKSNIFLKINVHQYELGWYFITTYRVINVAKIGYVTGPFGLGHIFHPEPSYGVRHDL